MQPVLSFDNTFSLLHHINPIADTAPPGFSNVLVQVTVRLFLSVHTMRFMCLYVFPLRCAPAHRPPFVSDSIEDVSASDTARKFAVVRFPIDDFAADHASHPVRCIFAFDTLRILLLDTVLAVIAILLAIRRWNKRFAADSAGNRLPFNLFHVGLLITGPAAFHAAGRRDLSDLHPAAVSAEAITDSHNR